MVTHSLSVISIQASAAQSVVDTAPDQLRVCLRAIEAVSREAWAEMRLFLDRQTGTGGADEPPRAGLEHLAELVERFEQTGLSVDLVVTGDVRPLPADVFRQVWRAGRHVYGCAESGQTLAILMAAMTPLGILGARALDPSTPPYELMIVYAQVTGAWLLGEMVRYRRR